jgi:hypothetical protein
MNKIKQKPQEVLDRTNLPTFLTLFNKINSLQIQNTAKNYGILHRLGKHLSQHNLKIFHPHHI